MLKRIISGAVASTLSAALLAGCGGGGGSQAVPSTPSGGGSKTTNAQFTITIPGSSGVSVKGAKRLPLYVSRNTKGIGVEFQATGSPAYSGAPSTSPAVASAIAAGSGGCGAASGTGSFTCTVYLPGVPVGYNDLRITLWDAAPSAGSFAGDHALSIYVATNQVTLAGIVNNLGPFTTLPVVASAYVQLANGIVDGAASDVTGYVVAKDAQGNTILGGDNLVDASYNNVTLQASINNNSGASLAFTAPAAGATVSYTTAGTNAFTLHYNGAVQFASSGATQPSLSVAASAGTVSNTQGSSLQVTQSQNTITVPGQPQVATLATYSAGPTGITVGSDGALWLAGGGGITRTTTAGATVGFNNPQGLIGTAGLIAAGSEGYLWYTDTANNKIGRFAPVSSGSLSVTETPAISGATLTGIALGPDGNIWFGDSAHSQLDTVDPNNFSAAWSVGVNQFNLASAPSKVKSGPLFNGGAEKSVCAVEPSAPAVQCLDLTTKALTAVTTAATPVSMVVGPDNKLYVGEVGKIEVFSVSGSTFGAGTPYSLTAAGAPQVQSITVSQDGNLWFVETGATNPTFGNLNIQSATPALNEFSANTNIGAGTTPYQLILNANNGTLYFTDNSAHNALKTITP